MIRTISLAMLLFAAPAAAQQSPQAVLDELVAAERSLSEAAAKLDPAEGIASMIAADGVLMTPKGPMRGPEAALASLKANPANAGKYASWRSIRGGVSADGQQGFTLGYLDIEGGDAARAHRRYLAYWVRGANGWRVAALKQILQAPDETIVPAQQPDLPVAIVAPDPDRTSEHTQSLIAAEKSFSDRAQEIGITQAFQEFGQPDATHIFGPTGFAIGLAAIRANHEQAERAAGPGPTPINWSADSAIVASSGDLGVTIGAIRRNTPTAEGPASNPFFTIWRRDGPDKPWRYIAE